MKLNILLILTVILYIGCASSSKPMEGLVSLEKALEGAVEDLGLRVHGKTEIVIAAIDTSLAGVSDFISDELAGLLVSSGNFIILERGNALKAINTEHEFQMSGLVNDESAVGIGHYLGAKVVLTGTFNRFADFNQLRVRAIDVETSQILTLYNIRILPNDRLLANIIRQEDQIIKAPAITENAITYLNQGIDLFNEGNYEGAIEALNKAIAINKNLAEAYYHRANALFEYGEKLFYVMSDDEYKKVLQIMGMKEGDFYLDIVINNYNSAISLKPDYIDAIYNRGFMYWFGNNYDRALEDLTAVIKIKSDHIDALFVRANIYDLNENDDLAIADYTAILKIEPNNQEALFNRGKLYHYGKNDFTKAIADFETILRINPNHNDAKIEILKIYTR